MTDEVKFSKFTETGEYVNSFDLDTFVRLFVNHQPVYGIGKPHIEKAFGVLNDGETKLPYQSAELKSHLQKEGEIISPSF